MASSGPNYPGTGASLANSGTSENANAWANPGNVGSSSAVASITAATFDSPDISEILVCSNFGFSVSGTITGIYVEISKRGYTSTNSGKDFRVQLSTSTAFSGLVGDNKASADVWPQTTLSTVAYGGSSDTWNASLTAAQVNSSGFAVFVSAYANVANADIEVDWVRVTITYSPSVSATTTLATATGTANADAAKVGATSQAAATGTGSALAATGRPGARGSAGAATVTGSAAGVTAKVVANVDSEAAAAADARAPSAKLAVPLGYADTSAAALDATAEADSGQITFNAECATATAAAVVARGRIAAGAGYAQARTA